jgi:hypothetical protein
MTAKVWVPHVRPQCPDCFDVMRYDNASMEQVEAQGFAIARCSWSGCPSHRRGYKMPVPRIEVEIVEEGNG